MLQQQSKSNVSKILDVQVDSKCLQENLLICNLTLRMDKIQSDDLQKIVQYINSKIMANCILGVVTNPINFFRMY